MSPEITVEKEWEIKPLFYSLRQARSPFRHPKDCKERSPIFVTSIKQPSSAFKIHLVRVFFKAGPLLPQGLDESPPISEGLDPPLKKKYTFCAKATVKRATKTSNLFRNIAAKRDK